MPIRVASAIKSTLVPADEQPRSGRHICGTDGGDRSVAIDALPVDRRERGFLKVDVLIETHPPRSRKPVGSILWATET